MVIVVAAFTSIQTISCPMADASVPDWADITSAVMVVDIMPNLDYLSCSAVCGIIAAHGILSSSVLGDKCDNGF